MTVTDCSKTKVRKVMVGEDGTLYLKKDSMFPWNCPCCDKLTEYYVDDIIECAWCGYVGFPEEFEAIWELKDSVH